MISSAVSKHIFPPLTSIVEEYAITTYHLIALDPELGPNLTRLGSVQAVTTFGGMHKDN